MDSLSLVLAAVLVVVFFYQKIGLFFFRKNPTEEKCIVYGATMIYTYYKYIP
jgi:hypothetical protein